jgi:DNA-binding response OmpR family regulator
VEDEFLIRFMLADFLSEYGFQVSEAASADDAIELLEHCDESFDVVFSDVNMPGNTDGFGLARWIHTNRPGTPVLLTSGVARKVTMVKEGFPADSLIEKPYDLRQLAEQIHSLAESAH